MSEDTFDGLDGLDELYMRELQVLSKRVEKLQAQLDNPDNAFIVETNKRVLSEARAMFTTALYEVKDQLKDQQRMARDEEIRVVRMKADAEKDNALAQQAKKFESKIAQCEKTIDGIVEEKRLVEMREKVEHAMNEALRAELAMKYSECARLTAEMESIKKSMPTVYHMPSKRKPASHCCE